VPELPSPELPSDKPEPKCAVCSRPVLDGEQVVFSHGDLIHTTCRRRLESQPLLAESRRLLRESRELLDRPLTFDNPLDDNGWPVCPACIKSIRPAEAAARQERSMVHAGCWKPKPAPPTS
jgi:hypothetical protein